LVSPAVKRYQARKSQRGTTVVVVVMVTTLITAIGVFAVRNASQIDQAVGYSRQSSQTIALAELGTSAAISEFGANKAAAYVAQMVNQPETCIANSILPAGTPCARLFRSDIEASTKDTLLEPTVGGSETGSLGPSGAMMGDLYVEVTERHPTGRPIAGTDLGGTGPELKYAKVTLTTTAQIRPTAPTGSNDNLCNAGVAAVAAKKVMRARVVVGPI
jgi:hypothetical protein